MKMSMTTATSWGVGRGAVDGAWSSGDVQGVGEDPGD